MNRSASKRARTLVAITIPFVFSNQSFATDNDIDVVPAATLLLPHFEVDLANTGGLTTLFSVNNGSPDPQLAHITFWTDQSRPTLDFTIYPNLNSNNPHSDFPGDTLQSWVGTLFQASSRFAVGLQGVHFDHATDPRDVCIGVDGSITEGAGCPGG